MMGNGRGSSAKLAIRFISVDVSAFCHLSILTVAVLYDGDRIHSKGIRSRTFHYSNKDHGISSSSGLR